MEEWFDDFKTFKAQYVPDESLPKGMMSMLKDINFSKKIHISSSLVERREGCGISQELSLHEE